MPETYFYLNGQKYWYYGSYNEKDKAFKKGRELKKTYGGKYFIKATDHWYGTYPIYHVYATRVRNLWT